MRPGTHTGGDVLVMQFVERVNRAGDGPAARDAYRDAFRSLRGGLELYPPPGARASHVFESTAGTARSVAAACLPLGLAIAMHLYPLCVLQCLPLPYLSPARLQRAKLLRAIRKRTLVVANTGGERSGGEHDGLTAREDPRGIRIDGTCEYMSLASVADLVFFKACLADGTRTALCAADLTGGTVHVGDWRFSGNLRLSDTSAVTFAGHLVPHGRYLFVPDGAVLQSISDYQRCWFHLFLAETYLARIRRVHDEYALRRSAEDLASLNELMQLRAYALQLLDSVSAGAGVGRLQEVTSAIKLRVSLMAQATIAAVGAENRDIGELRYIRWQPTADDRILHNIQQRLAPLRLQSSTENANFEVGLRR